MVTMTREELTSLLGDFKREMEDMRTELAEMKAKSSSAAEIPEAAPVAKDSEEKKEEPDNKKAGGMAAMLLAAAAKEKDDAAAKEVKPAAPTQAKAGGTAAALLAAAAKEKEASKPATPAKGGAMAAALLAAAKEMKSERENASPPGNSSSFSGAALDNSNRNYDDEVDVDEIIEKNSSRNLDGAGKDANALLAGVVGNMLKKPEPEQNKDVLATAVSGMMKPNASGAGGKVQTSRLAGAIGDVMHQNRVEKRGDTFTFGDLVEDVVHEEKKKSAILLRNEKSVMKAAEAFKTSKRILLATGSLHENGSLSGGPSDDEGSAVVKPEDDEDDDDNWHAPFGETIYTLMYMCPLNSQSFFYSLFVYGLQIATITLTMVDIIDMEVDNSLLLPPNVDLTVTIAQGVTLFIVLGYMSDLIEAVLKLQDGFYPEILEVHPGADYLTWLISGLAQLTSGLLVLIGSFILTMQASTVIDLMLNLTALLFISELDDIGFLIAKLGFVTDVLQKQTEAVADFEVPKRKNHNLKRRVLYVLTMIGLEIGFGVLKTKQLNGDYLPTFIYVQFGDAYNPKIPFFSGVLEARETRTSGYREYQDVGTKGMLLSYCAGERAWTFTDVNDPCEYFAKSEQTDDYDVTNIPNNRWFVKDTIGRMNPFDTFALTSRDCNPNVCQGKCQDGLCVCPHDKFGLDCEFDDVCPYLVLDSRTLRLPTIIWDANWLPAKEFEILTHNRSGEEEYVKVYNMPVYYSDTSAPSGTLIFFGGRRWILTSEYTFLNMTMERNNQDRWEPGVLKRRVAERFLDEFHGYEQAVYTPYFLSDPIDYQTPNFRPTPSGVGWWSVRVLNSTERLYEPDALIDTRFVCESCVVKDDGFCGMGGVCNETSGKCDCYDQYKGKKCEAFGSCNDFGWPCFGDGECDRESGICRCNLPWADKLCLGLFGCFEDGGECQNGGTCADDAVFCECPADPGITGMACEKFLDCHVNGCLNGGVCALNGKCACRPPFTGVNCGLVDETQEDLLCNEDSDCMNGTCNNRTRTCDCEDPNSFGSLCQLGFDCTWGGCLNGGTCNEETGVCENCDAPFHGPDCSKGAQCADQEDPDGYCATQIDEMSVCDLERNTCQCGWPGWFLGLKCHRNCKLEGGCYNGGHCNPHGFCECKTPYAGTKCEYLAEDVGEILSQDLEFMQSCLDEEGFPPYLPNQTDCTKLANLRGW